jgi:DNA-binding MarR family transcriptional regulator
MAGPRLRLDDFMPYRLSVASNAVSNAIASAYQALFGLTVPEWRVLAVTAEDAGMTQQAIVARTRMDKVTVSRATLALVERGLIARRRNETDGRSQRLSLTAAGTQLYAAIVPAARDMETRVFGVLSAEEQAELRRLLDRIDAAATSLDVNVKQT